MDDGATRAIEAVARGQLLEVRLDNPPDNRITPEMLNELGRAVERFETEDFELLVLTGAGSVFSKGVDVDAMSADREPGEQYEMLVLANALFSRIAHLRKPTIAAINGACLGGGLELALTCHFRLCADRARLGLPEIWINLVPGLGGYYRLSRLVGQAKALELVSLGDLITAAEALRLNVVNRVYPRRDFAEQVASFAKALLVADRRVLREVLHLASRSAAPGEEDNIREGMESFARFAPWLQES